MKDWNPEQYTLEEYEEVIVICFPFRVNKSFLSYRYGQPITIPAKYNDILRQNRAQDKRTELAIGDSLYPAHLRQGFNNGGEYFQFTSGIDDATLGNFVLGEILTVTIDIRDDNLIILEKGG